MFTSTNYKTKKIWGHSKKYVTCGKGKIIDKKVKKGIQVGGGTAK